MVNYSKWDNLALGSDDDEPRTSGVPNVTKLEGPSTVTFGGGLLTKFTLNEEEFDLVRRRGVLSV